MTAEERLDVRLLAVDLGLRLGWAAFGSAGRLLAYGSRHYGNRTVLWQAVPKILGDFPHLATLVLEGGGDLAVPWQKEGARRGVALKQVHSEAWRTSILTPTQRRDPKASAEEVARTFIQRSGAKLPTSLRHDAAEAILVGAWAVGSASCPPDARLT